MAKPGLLDHPKFRRLLRILGEPRPHVLGYLECLWHVAYQTGDDLLGDAVDVEAAAEYPGEPGRFTRAAIEAGFVVCGENGEHRVYNLYRHAPRYVKKRMLRNGTAPESAQMDHKTAKSGPQGRSMDHKTPKSGPSGRNSAPNGQRDAADDEKQPQKRRKSRKYGENETQDDSTEERPNGPQNSKKWPARTQLSAPMDHKTPKSGPQERHNREPRTENREPRTENHKKNKEEMRPSAAPPGPDGVTCAEKEHTHHADAIAYFCEQWKAKYGQDYPFDGPKHGAIIRRVLIAIGRDLSRFHAAVNRYLADPDPFYAGHGLPKFSAHLERWLVAPTPAARRTHDQNRDDEFAQLIIDTEASP